MILLLALGYSINLLTLLALVLAIGLVVDDAIVVVENIHRHIEEGLTPVRGGDPGRARDRPAGHRDDHHARRRLCADRLRLGPHRRAVPRVRLHAGGRGHRLGRHRADPLADDVLAPALRAGARGALRRVPRPAVQRAARPLPPPAAPHAELPRDDRAGPARRRRHDRAHVPHHAEGTGARGGPGCAVRAGQDAAICQSRLPGAGDRFGSPRCSRRCPSRRTPSPSTARRACTRPSPASC